MFIFLLTVSILLGGFLVQNRLQDHASTNQIDRLGVGNPIEDQAPIDKVNNGVYTNFKYGFRFEYPEEVFIHEGGSLESGEEFVRSWDVLESGGSHVGGEDGAHLLIRVNHNTHSKEKELETLNAIRNITVGTIDKKTGYKRFPNFSNGGAYYSFTGNEVTAYFRPNFFAAWNKGDDTFWLSIMINSEEPERVEYFQKIFEAISESFTFDVTDQ